MIYHGIVKSYVIYLLIKIIKKEKSLDFSIKKRYNYNDNGGVAQLGERLLRM